MSTPIALLRARMSHTDRRLRRLRRVERALTQLQVRRRQILGHLPDPRPTIMYDDVNLDLIPADAPAVAGYVGGLYPTYGKLANRFPHARRLSIAINASENADCLDIERGDATPEQAPGWVRRQLARGVKRPKVYASVADMQHIIDLLAEAMIARSQVHLWTAHFTFHPHVCGPGCGFGLREHADATQYTDKALGRSMDETLCTSGFWT